MTDPFDDERQRRVAKELAEYIDRQARVLAVDMLREAEVLAAAMLMVRNPEMTEEQVWQQIRARRPDYSSLLEPQA